MIDAPYLLNLLKTEGVEAGLSQIKIDDINDPTARIICRTIAYANKRIVYYLEEIIKNPKLVE